MKEIQAGWRGIDVSHWQGLINWHRASTTDHIKWAAVKITEGTSFVDARAIPNLKGARNMGVVAASYHFARPAEALPIDRDVAAQVAHFTEHWDHIGPAVLDWEATSHRSSSSLEESDPKWQAEWIAEWASQVGPTIVYADRYIALRVGEAAKGAGIDLPDLWLADWIKRKASPADTPNPDTLATHVRDVWPNIVWWQWADKGTVCGITARYTDLDVALTGFDRT